MKNKPNHYNDEWYEEFETYFAMGEYTYMTFLNFMVELTIAKWS